VKLQFSVLFFIFVFCSNQQDIKAQGYKQILAQFNEWHVTSCFFGCITDVYYTDSDTVINGFTYSILDGYHYINRNFLLREDTIEKQVFFLATGIGKEDLEYLLYDFSLLPGDSMLIYNPISPFPDSAGYFILDSIVPEVLIDGDTYKHFYLSAIDSAKSVTGRAEWIEGIGSLNLINTPGAYGDVNGAGALSCFFNNQTLHYSNLDSIAGCIQVYPNLSSGAIQSDRFVVNMYPNPASNQVFIETELQELEKINIFDMLGRLLMIAPLGPDKTHQINTQDLQPGTYLIQLTNNMGEQFAQKLIIE